MNDCATNLSISICIFRLQSYARLPGSKHHRSQSNYYLMDMKGISKVIRSNLLLWENPLDKSVERCSYFAPPPTFNKYTGADGSLTGSQPGCTQCRYTVELQRHFPH